MLEKEIPDIAFDIENEVDPESYITGIKCFTNYTARLIEAGSPEKLQNCFRLADRLLSESTDSVKTVVTVQFMTLIYPLLKANSPQAYRAQNFLNGHLLNQFRYSVSMDSWQ